MPAIALRRSLLSPLLALALLATAISPVARAYQASGTAESRFTVADLLDVVNFNPGDLSDDGRWLAATSSSLRDRLGIDNHRFGDPTYVAPSFNDVWVIETQTAKAQSVFAGSPKQQARSLRWSPGASHLAMLVLKGETFTPMIWERATGKLRQVDIPKGKHVADNTDFQWSPDGSQLILSLRTNDWLIKARERFDYETKGPVVVHSTKESFLAWEDLRRMSLTRSLVSYEIKTGQMREILPDMKLRSYDLAEDGLFISYQEDITKKTDYDVIGGSDNQVQIIPTAGGPPRTIIKSTKGINLIWSRDGRRYAYSKEGNIFFAGIDDKEPRQLIGKKPSQEDKEKAEDKPKEDSAKDADKEKKEKERFNAVRLSTKGDWLVASNKEGIWLIDTASGTKEMFVKTSEEDKEGPRYQVIEWSPDAENIYMTYGSRTKWERGLVRYNVKTKKLEDLVKDSHLYFGLRLSKDGRTFVFASAEGNRTGDLFVADADLKNVRRLTDANPQLKAKRLSKTELISYLDTDGNKMYGVLYYPVDYEAGKKYPTVFNIYEQFFDDNFNGTINILTSNGYAVMQPSVNLEIGFPGEAWMKGVTSAANKLIEMGIADPERLGVQGTSYGGYATNLLITQTNRFRAAINISGKVNMISFYTDSPRLGVRNIHAPEKSQDRIGATLWQQPQKYIQQSAIMFADRIKTPLLLMTGEQDHNVPPRQAMEMYYALRRLNKEVEWVSYTNGGHGMPTTAAAEVEDYHKRILKWYDDHLKGDLKKKAEEQKAEQPAQ
ncbi:MAG TPA: prolyl oligopeptidase family serine peptidase [Blastocatellia bacterium]|nr:prolyl oligopeptidase family serine peptidase [Blastocatellia bacterium]